MAVVPEGRLGPLREAWTREEPPPKDPEPAPFIDWAEFWERDRREAEWLLDDILARGRGHAIYAPQKAGKSLLTLWCALELVKSGVLVVYLDYEMSEDDLYERLEDMGCGPSTDLSLLRYWLLPTLPPLDKADGADAVLRIVDQERLGAGDRHVALIIDTTGRAVAGEENSADTYRDFYRHTGIGLKQRGVTWARLDHAGKDVERGQRGSSAKGDDVDIVWRLAKVDGGVELRRDVARMGWVPERVPLRLEEEPVLRYVRTESLWPAGTAECAEVLARIGCPLDASTRVAQAMLKAVGEGRRRAVVVAGQRWRQAAAEDREKGLE